MFLRQKNREIELAPWAPWNTLYLQRRNCTIMPDRCVVFGCSNVANAAKEISFHLIPFFNDEKSEAKRRRKRWVDFVKATRDKWVPTKNSAVCSEHFTPESFSRRISVMSDSETHFSSRLTRDDFGIAAYPMIQTKIVTELTIRDRRMVSTL